MSDWIFGIDGGGTSSRIRAESLLGERLYIGSGGGTNPNSTEKATVASILRGLIEGAINSGLEPSGCRAGYIGSAGVDRPGDKATMAAALAGAFEAAASSKRRVDSMPLFGVGNDAEPALVGALGDIEGFLMIAGTGSIALGRTRSGRSVRAGGWGHFLGDEGSAFWIAFEAVKRGIRSSEGRDEKSGLLGEALKHFGLPEAQALIPFAYSAFDKAKIASFAPRVAALAASGDLIARSILDEAADELTALVASVHGALAADMASRRLALYGGLLEKNRELREAVSGRVLSRFPDIAIVEAVGDAQAGACRLARELL